MEAAAAVAHDEPTGAISKQFAERRDAILERHGAGLKCTSPADAGDVVFALKAEQRLRLRLRLQAARPRIGPRARLAGRRHRRTARSDWLDHGFPRRALAQQQVLDLIAGERLEFEQ